MQGLPASFDWDRDYAPLQNLMDWGAWAYLFARRAPDWEDVYQTGLSYQYELAPANESPTPEQYRNALPHTLWRRGVLHIGRHGHGTSESLLQAIRSRHNALFVPDGNDLPNDRPISTTVRGGRLAFCNQQDHQGYQAMRGLIVRNTLELMLNLNVPKTHLLEEVERLIDTAQSPIKTRKDAEPPAITWARGLAAWDLQSYKVSNYAIAQGIGVNITQKTIKDSLKAVRPYIEQGQWRSLAGDPFLS